MTRNKKNYTKSVLAFQNTMQSINLYNSYALCDKSVKFGTEVVTYETKISDIVLQKCFALKGHNINLMKNLKRAIIKK